ncbi:anti-sigma factor family protein [Embleya scabrispora]|uniref:anti-sigma factor family protein n=1 Tax=Embleya scabrispora TaxID=159449 RepID=UPI001374FDC2|nr:zf-HC2 domain-containing protein [Embleya scabrispora]
MTDIGDEGTTTNGTTPGTNPPPPARPPGTPAPLGCAVARLDLGAFVVGALDEDEAARVRTHVARCPRCRAEYEELAGLPRMLARLSEPEARASGAAAQGAAPARLLSAAAVRADRGRRLRSLAAAAAAVLVLLAGLTGWALGDTGGDGDTAAAPTGAVPGTPTAPATPPGTAPSPAQSGGRTVRAGDPRSGAGAELRYAATAWGSSVDLSLSGIRPGTRCRLDVYGTKGRVETASSWVVPDGEYPPADPIRGATSIPVGEITRFSVRTVGGGEQLLEIPPAQP